MSVFNNNPFNIQAGDVWEIPSYGGSLKPNVFVIEGVDKGMFVTHFDGNVYYRTGLDHIKGVQPYDKFSINFDLAYFNSLVRNKTAKRIAVFGNSEEGIQFAITSVKEWAIGIHDYIEADKVRSIA